ncbi:fasciclin domain-containing protein [Sphingobacterium lumbrici]|uniref:fasciclin domain-containing protein n=1 Tax=Sphingobacterium lumbrici TaxID=2559600 RepID=UPI0015E3CC16|nr:fasciclin domain-containing protein [Sphingobacterium lumbrici]
MKIQIRILLMVVSITAVSLSCTKYYFDGGVHDPKYNGTILDYMKEKKPFFDSTLMVIELAGMTDVFQNENVTFFAPPGGTVHNVIQNLNRHLRFNGKDTVSRLDQIKSEVWRNTLSQYIFRGTNLLKDYPQRDTLSYVAYPGQNYTSYGGDIMNIGVIFNDAGGVTYAGYRQLYIAYIPDLSNPQVSLTNIPVATSDIQPKNGVIHVLNRTKHTYGFRTNAFIDQAISAGISPATP